MSESRLFGPVTVGNVQLKHRMVMAPLTRFRADADHIPLPIVADYYGQRASVPGTLIISEATFISKRAGGYPNVPGIWNSDQVAAWRKVTDIVHQKGSAIFLQLWALGRVAIPDVAQAEGFDIVSSSPTPLDSGSPVPKALSKEEIQGFISDYVQAARNAMDAGFDGVEIHGAGGYLIDQFTQDNCNKLASAVKNAIGSKRVGIRLSPWQRYQGMRMDNPLPQFIHVIHGLKDLDLAYLHLIEARVCGNVDSEDREKNNVFVEAWGNSSPVILAGGFTPASAKTTVDEEFKGRDIMIAFGRHYISNPDLPFRIRRGLDLNSYNRDTFYLPMSSEGYVDYGFSKEFERHGGFEGVV